MTEIQLHDGLQKILEHLIGSLGRSLSEVKKEALMRLPQAGSPELTHLAFYDDVPDISDADQLPGMSPQPRLAACNTLRTSRKAARKEDGTCMYQENMTSRQFPYLRVLALSILVGAGCAAPSQTVRAEGFVPIPCVDIPTALLSSFPPNNTQYGGHLTAHIAGMTPPPGYSQAGKTLFWGTQDYEDAWNALRQQHPPLYCAGNPVIGAEAARDVPTQLFSKQCTAANAQGVCTASNDIQTNSVTFVFRAVNNNNRIEWILYTAYPRP